VLPSVLPHTSPKSLTIVGTVLRQTTPKAERDLGVSLHCYFIFVLTMGQFMSTDFVRQNSPGILRSRKPRHRIKLLGKTRGLNLIKRKKSKPQEQNIWRHIWGAATLLQGQMAAVETLKMAGWPNYFSMFASSFPVHSSSLKRSRSASSFSVWRVPTTLTSTEMILAPIRIWPGLHVPTICTSRSEQPFQMKLWEKPKARASLSPVN